MAGVLPTAVCVFALTLFLDALELSFDRILWFMRTLRFWLYFALHLILSGAAAYLLYRKIPDWYLLAPVASFLAVSVISNTDVKVAGIPLIPVAQLFVSIKKKMYDQAAEEALGRKTSQLLKAQLIERLQRLPLDKIKAAHQAALVGAGQKVDSVVRKQEQAEKKAQRDQNKYKLFLIEHLMDTNLEYVQKNIAEWEK